MPATSESTRHALYLALEASYGVLGATPAFSRVRNTTCNIALSKEGFATEESDPQRQVRDYRHGNKQTGGEIGIELSYGSFDEILQGILFSADWAPREQIIDSALISAANADSSYNGTDLPIFRVGEIVVVSGFTGDLSNNGNKTVVTSTDTKLVVAEALVDEAAGDDVSLITLSESIKAGVTRRSYSLLRHFEDQEAPKKGYHLYPGWMFSTLNLTIAPGGAIKGTVSGVGANLLLDPDQPADSTLGVPTTSRMFDSFTGWIKEGDVSLATMAELTLTLENGVEPIFVCFSDTTLEPSVGRSNLTGQLMAYFNDSTLLEKFIDETPSSLEFELIDKAGNSYRFYIPNISYTGGQVDTATEGPISIPLPFQAIADSILDSQIRVERIPASA